MLTAFSRKEVVDAVAVNSKQKEKGGH